MNTYDTSMLIRAASGARKPWLSPDALFEFKYAIDSQSAIDKCCVCNRAECVNCLARGERIGKKGRPRAIAENALAEFMSMIQRNVPQKSICEQLGISRKTYFNYKKKLSKGVII